MKRAWLFCFISVPLFANQPDSSKNAVYATNADWSFAEKRTRNAVVQVWSQSLEFNWLLPFKSPEQAQGAGSGFFIDAEGHLLTNYHVVRGARSVFINVPSLGRQPLAVTVRGVCPDLDLALLTLTKESKALLTNIGKINFLELGDSDILQETQQILAVGFPLAFPTPKYTIGWVAGRDYIDDTPLIHITAPINPGNSGGPLLTHDAKVVGINSQKWENSDGYNYIIPMSDIRIVLPDLYKHPLVRKPELSLGANPTTQAHARDEGNPIPAGYYVNYVVENSMEAKAGLRLGDMLYEIKMKNKTYRIDEYGEVKVPWRAGHSITVEELLSRCLIGDPLAFVIYRKGERKELKALFEQPMLYTFRHIYPEYEQAELDYEILGGMVVMQLRKNHTKILQTSPQYMFMNALRKYTQIENHAKPALIITSILKGSQAHLSGCLMTGYLLDKINGKMVTTLEELRQALTESLSSGVIRIDTKDKTTTVLTVSDVLADEQLLAQDYRYQITPGIKMLNDSF